MSKFSLLVMGGAVGLLCAGSPAVMAQSTAPGGSKTNAGETKPLFKIPNGGNFRYNGKSSQGEFLLMEVKWQAAGMQPDGTIRVSGDVKYKNPKTDMMDMRTINGNKSYITKTGELFFAMNDIGDKVFGPVDLIELEAARLAKSEKPAESKEREHGVSGTGGAPSKLQSSESLTQSNAATMVSKQDSLGDEDDNGSMKTNSSSISQRCAFNDAKAYDDRFKASGSFRVDNDTFHWKQTNSTLGNYRKILVRYANTCSLLSAADQYKSVLNDQGKAHTYFRGKSVKSKESFLSGNFKVLTKAHNLIKEEDDYIRMFGLQTLPGALRNNKKKIVTTEGALMLGAVVKSIGKENIAHKRTPLGIHAFNSIQGLLKLEKSDWVVHRIVQHAGLNVKHHPTRGRSLVQGETSAAGAARGQYTTIDDIVANRPAPVWQEDLVNEILQGRRTLNPTLDHVNFGRALVESGLDTPQERANYARDLTTYFRNQRALFPNGLANETAANFQRSMTNLLTATWEVRQLTGRSPITISQYNGYSRNFTNLLAALHKSGRLAIEADDFRNMLARIPGFQPDREQLRNIMRSEIQTILDNWRITDQLSSKHNLPAEIARAILLLALSLSPLGV